jgi:hypothetical protein
MVWHQQRRGELVGLDFLDIRRLGWKLCRAG